MSVQAIYITVGSFGRAWAVRMLDHNGVPIDLTAASDPKFSMRKRGNADRKVENKPAVIGNGTYTLPDGSSLTITPADGVMIYQPVEADVDEHGAFIGQFSYSLGGATVIDPAAGYVDIIIQPSV